MLINDASRRFTFHKSDGDGFSLSGDLWLLVRHVCCSFPSENSTIDLSDRGGGGVRKMRGPANELEQFVISIIFTGFFNWTPGLFLRWVATFLDSLIDLLLTPPPMCVSMC